MNKDSRKLLIQKLAAEKNMVVRSTKQKKSKSVDFIAFINPTEDDVRAELEMMGGYSQRNKR
jgi:hypothetical protein